MDNELNRHFSKEDTQIAQKGTTQEKMFTAAIKEYK